MDPGPKAQAALASLRSLLATHSTRSVVQSYLLLCMKRANDIGFQGELVSPARQGDVLLTLLLSTIEPAEPIPYEPDDWRRTTELLNEAFEAYLGLFWPDPEETGALSDEWTRVREVAMPAFLHYFNTGLIASPEQVRARILTYLTPFDTAFRDAWSMTATDALRIADWIGARLQSNLVTLNMIRDDMCAAQNLCVQHARDQESAHEFARRQSPDLGHRFASALDDFGTVTKSELLDAFDEVGEQYWRHFSVGRGEASPVVYPTDATAAATRPLIRLNDERAIIPAINSLWTALLEVGEDVVTKPPIRDRYLRHRDSALEAEVAAQFRRLVSAGAQVLEGAFEYPDSRGEHDLIVVDGDTIFIVEAKASPPSEPLRDPEKAFMRIRHAFRADKGIQKGFEQAESIRSKLERREPVPLFDRHGSQVALLDPLVLTQRFSVIVTRDDFGILATDLALLLEKDACTPYPWAVNIFDLTAIADAWQYLGRGTPELRAYLSPRLQLHGKVLTWDELELVGYSLQHGSLESLVNNAYDLASLDGSYSDFFDQLYQHQRYDGPPPVAQSTTPVVMDLRASLAAGSAVFVDGKTTGVTREHVVPTRSRRMHGTARNQPCPCGSGRKFKRCCGK